MFLLEYKCIYVTDCQDKCSECGYPDLQEKGYSQMFTVSEEEKGDNWKVPVLRRINSQIEHSTIQSQQTQLQSEPFDSVDKSCVQWESRSIKYDDLYRR